MDEPEVLARSMKSLVTWAVFWRVKQTTLAVTRGSPRRVTITDTRGWFSDVRYWFSWNWNVGTETKHGVLKKSIQKIEKNSRKSIEIWQLGNIRKRNKSMEEIERNLFSRDSTKIWKLRLNVITSLSTVQTTVGFKFENVSKIFWDWISCQNASFECTQHSRRLFRPACSSIWKPPIDSSPYSALLVYVTQCWRDEQSRHVTPRHARGKIDRWQ